MKKFRIHLAMVAAAFSAISLSEIAAQAQSVPGSTGTAGGTSGSSATGINSATTQAPTSTFQLQDFSRNSSLNSGTQIQPLSQPSGLLQNHAPVIQPGSYGVPTTSNQTRQFSMPNMNSTPNPVMPAQANRSVLSSPSPVMPTYQKSPALQQLQPQLINH